jgi:hypothetical protein
LEDEEHLEDEEDEAEFSALELLKLRLRLLLGLNSLKSRGTNSQLKFFSFRLFHVAKNPWAFNIYQKQYIVYLPHCPKESRCL